MNARGEIDDLAETVRNLRKADFWANRKIALHLGLLGLDASGRLYRAEPDGGRVYGGCGDAVLLDDFNFTGSLDDLAERIANDFPGWAWVVSRDLVGVYCASLMNATPIDEPADEIWPGGVATAVHDTAALALCLAFVLALRYRPERSRR